MLRTETNSAHANPSAVHFKEAQRGGEHPTARRGSLAEVRPSSGDYSSDEYESGSIELGTSALGAGAFGEVSGDVDLRNIMGKTEAELSWALAASTPLAVLGATLLAHGSTLPSDLCIGLGTLSILTIFVLQIRARMRVRGLFAEQAVAQGLSPSLGKKHARKYLNAWFR